MPHAYLATSSKRAVIDCGVMDNPIMALYATGSANCGRAGAQGAQLELDLFWDDSRGRANFGIWSKEIWQ